MVTRCSEKEYTVYFVGEALCGSNRFDVNKALTYVIVLPSVEQSVEHLLHYIDEVGL